MRKFFWMSGIFLFCLMLSFISSVPVVSAKDLVIGINTPLSGPAAPTGLGLLRAIELAADDINAHGGIKAGKETYTIKLITYDSKYDVKEALAAVNKLIYSDKVKYIVTMGGTCVIAVNPLITENKILHIGYAYGGKKATNPNVPIHLPVHL